MPAWPDGARVAAFLARARRRLAWLAAMRGAAIGLAFAALIVAAGWAAHGRLSTALGLAAIALAASVGVAVAADRRGGGAALRLEARVPACRNIVVTADEILRHPDRVRPYIGARVCQDAARTASSIDLSSVFPMRGPLAALAVTAALAVAAAAAAIAGAPVPAALALDAVAPAAVIRQVEITVTPPEYSRLPASRIEDPERITALAGSRIDVVVQGRADRGAIETAAGRTALNATAGGRLAGSVFAREDGYIAVDAQRGSDDDRRLIGLTVTPDAAPVVRITSPGKDLVFGDGTQTIALEVSAEDDLALASLRVAFTKVTGSGENFTFADGDIPLSITRAGDRRWTAAARWALAPLQLEPGDMVVYRAIARDRRPGAPDAESDAFIVEVLAPGSIASEGFAIDDERDRYAISQQMVILKTERLIARRGSIAAGALLEQAQLLAAEQRQVRAEFVFMMGGHIEDEEVEAAGEHEVAEGRLENRGRVDLVLAIRAMSEAAASLTAADLTTGLAQERQALAALQRAFTRSRYILRTLSERERVEASRRLTGSLDGAARDVREPATAAASPRTDALGRALTETRALAARADLARAQAAAADAIAASLLRVDPAADSWRRIAATLARAAGALRGGDARAARASLMEAAAALAAALRAEAADAGPAAHTSARDRVMDGTLADALGRRGRR
jgi:hypothetical protein